MVQFFLVLPTYRKYDIRIFIALTCSPETVLYGVEVSRGPYTVGTQVKYECNPGYTMVGDSVVNCVDKGTTAGWNEDLPKCFTVGYIYIYIYIYILIIAEFLFTALFILFS